MWALYFRTAPRMLLSTSLSFFTLISRLLGYIITTTLIPNLNPILPKCNKLFSDYNLPIAEIPRKSTRNFFTCRANKKTDKRTGVIKTYIAWLNEIVIFDSATVVRLVWYRQQGVVARPRVAGGRHHVQREQGVSRRSHRRVRLPPPARTARHGG